MSFLIIGLSPQKEEGPGCRRALDRLSVAMFRHGFQLVLGPVGDGVDVAILVAHEIQLAGGNRHRLGADAEAPFLLAVRIVPQHNMEEEKARQ